MEGGVLETNGVRVGGFQVHLLAGHRVQHHPCDVHLHNILLMWSHILNLIEEKWLTEKQYQVIHLNCSESGITSLSLVKTQAQPIQKRGVIIDSATGVGDHQGGVRDSGMSSITETVAQYLHIVDFQLLVITFQQLLYEDGTTPDNFHWWC